MDGRVAVRHRERDRLAVDGRSRVLRPAGNAQLEIESRRRFRIYLDSRLARPWIVARLAERDFHPGQCRRRLEAAVEVEGNAVLARRDYIAGHRGGEPRNVHRAAGAEMPCPPFVLAAALERIGIEVMRPIA